MIQHQHLKNIDWIRAIASILVVTLHYHAISNSLTFYGLNLGTFIIDNILRLPVPLFLIISLFFFTRKIRTYSYLKQRIKKLLLIGTIWPVIFYFCHGGVIKCVERIIFIIKEVRRSPVVLWHYLFSDLETVYYFFISLSFVLLVAFLLQKSSDTVIFLCLVISLILLVILPIFQLNAFYNPINFIPYAPSAILINRYFSKIYNYKLMIGLVLLGIGIFLMIIESVMSNITGIIFISGYTKISLVFCSTGLFLISFCFQKSHKIIKFMSDFSLPLYLLHTCLSSLSGTISNIIFVKILKIEDINMYSCVISILLCYLIAKFILPIIFNKAIYSSG